MKKSLFALAACGAFVGSVGSAYAQSSVTLYGIIDEGLNYTNNVRGTHEWSMASGDVQGSRWGLKGSEDLGGGLKAIFQLENGFNTNNGNLGQGGRMFGRQAYVGLSSDQAGSLTMGRQYDSMVDYVAGLTANGNWAGLMFSHPFDNDNTNNSFRIDNSVKYTSANYSGFQFGGLYGFSNQAGGFANNRAVSVGAQYNNGPLAAGLAYLSVSNPGLTTGGAVTTNDASWIANRQRVFGAGINYTIAAATLGFVYTHTSLDNPTAMTSISGSIGAPSSIRFDNYELNAKYQLTPAMFLGGMYTFTDGKYSPAAGSSSKPKWHQFGLMADYSLSKRTDVYLQGVYQKVAGGSTGTALDDAFIASTDNSSSSSKQVTVRVGMRHRF